MLILFLFPFYSLVGSLVPFFYFYSFIYLFYFIFFVSTLSFDPRIMRGLLRFRGVQLRPGNYRSRPSFSSSFFPI